MRSRNRRIRKNGTSLRRASTLRSTASPLRAVKVYAPWCKTCRAFDLRYRKLASRFGDSKRDASKPIARGGRARFAEMELRDDNEGILRALLPRSKQPISLPYVLLYKGGRMERDFRCTPKTFRALVDAVEEMAADPVLVRGGSAGASVGDGEASGANDGVSKRSRETNGGASTTDVTTAGEAAMAKGRGLGAAQSYLSTLGTR